MKSNPLGKTFPYPSKFSPEILFPIPRSKYREGLRLSSVSGYDALTCYEVSWLDTKSLPQVAILRFAVSAASPNIVESKSLKLFLGSLNNEVFSSTEELITTVRQHLSNAYQSPLEALEVLGVNGCIASTPQGRCVDEIHNDTVTGAVHSTELQTYYSETFRSLCPVTEQPDWATVELSINGGVFDARRLRDYLHSLRNHQAFHERCCEEILETVAGWQSFTQISVRMFFLRRGGIEITPVRSLPTSAEAVVFRRLGRQ